MRTKLLILFVLVPGFLHAQDTLPQSKDLGAGAVMAGMYAYPASITFNDDENIIPQGFLVQKVQYYINKQLVFREMIEESPDTISKPGSNYAKVSLMDFSYLINRDSSILYYYQYKKDKIEKIIRYQLDSFTHEWFYRNAFRDALTIQRMDETKEILINNIPCFKGEAIEAKSGKPVVFYYHKRKEKITSPLDAFFNFKFKYNVTRIKFITDWTDQGVLKPGGGYMLFQVENYKAYTPDEKLFTLPPGIPVFNNISFSQVIMESRNDREMEKNK